MYEVYMNSNLYFACAVAATLALSTEGAAQERLRSEPRRAFAFSIEDENRAVIGVTTSTGSARDTLGVLVSSVTPGGPAEKAGIEEGNRIASVNGVNLRLAPADVGDWEMASAMSRRLTRELRKVDPGAEVDLRVYSGGQTRAVKIKTVSSDSLYRSVRRVRVDEDDRAALGVSLGSSGSKRDTLGVLIMGLDDEGPAAKAGIEEGNRIAAINGVDLRVPRDDAGDEMLASSRVRRLHRELEKVRPGDEVTLRLYVGGGRTRDVRLKTVAASSLPRRHRMFFGSEPFIAPIPPMAPIAPELRRHLEDELDRAGRAIERIGPRIERVFSTRVTD
jgi:S1-C subfamily serine protease